MEVSIETNALNVAYDDRIVIKNLDLKIPKGEITMLIGANGCGKSTLLKAIARILPYKSGNIIINNKNLHEHKNLAQIMAFLPQSLSAPEGILVRELVSHGRFPHLKPFAGLRAHDIDIIDESMRCTGVYDLADVAMDSLSGGQAQRVWISMILAQQPEILLMDEPTTYLDMSHQIEVLRLLRNMNNSNNTTILIVLHELNNASKFGDNLVGIRDGEIIFQGRPLDVVTKDNLKLLYGIDATLQLDSKQRYPICIDFEIDS